MTAPPPAFTLQATLVENGAVRSLDPHEAVHYAGPGFVWLHVEGAAGASLGDLPAHVPPMAANALLASETRPRCDAVDAGALINLLSMPDVFSPKVPNENSPV
jgi:zinc transporter